MNYETPTLTTYGKTLIPAQRVIDSPRCKYVIDNINKHFNPKEYAPPVGNIVTYDNGEVYKVVYVEVQRNEDTGLGYHRVLVTQEKVK